MRAVRLTNDRVSAAVESGESLSLPTSVIFRWTPALMEPGIWLWLHAALASTHPPAPFVILETGNKHTHTADMHAFTHTHADTHAPSSLSTAFIGFDTLLRPRLSQRRKAPKHTARLVPRKQHTKLSVTCCFFHLAKCLIMTLKYTLIT